MWQALLAAAVAGSTGLVAKHFFKASPDQEVQENGVCETPNGSRLVESGSVSGEKDGIFRFSSKGSRGVNGFRFGSRSLRRGGRLGGEVKKGGGEERSGSVERRRGRRVGVCLKRRKTGKSDAGKRGSSSSNDASSFGWGLGVGIMCMLSAGKSEFRKLNDAMSETAKVVEELKTELHKRKSTRNLPASGCASEITSNHHTTSFEQAEPGIIMSNKSSTNDSKNNGSPIVIDGECASSVLTEEHAPGMQDMDQLEAELELELQKLPGCTTDTPRQDGSKDLVMTEVSAQCRFPEHESHNSDNHQLGAILPAELDQKLCHLLIERQEKQIEEMESELHLAQCKLDWKEAELQALKDCVKRLSEVSISNISDDETEAYIEEEQTSDWNCQKVGSESNRSMVGMKRPIDTELM